MAAGGATQCSNMFTAPELWSCVLYGVSAACTADAGNMYMTTGAGTAQLAVAATGASAQ